MPKRILTQAQKDRMKEVTRLWRLANPEKVKLQKPASPEYQRLYQSTTKYKAKKKAASDLYRKAVPEKISAQRAVSYALKNGTMHRPEECERCKRKCKPHAHHVDYSIKLWVFWLCSKCHSAAHAAIREFQKAA